MPKQNNQTLDKTSHVEEVITLLKENNNLLRSIAEDIRKIKLNTS